MHFEPLLRSYLQSMTVGTVLLSTTLAGCTGGDAPKKPTKNQSCAADPASLDAGFVRGEGKLEIGDGESCPDVSALTHLTGWSCCPGLSLVEACSFTERRDDVPDTGFWDTSTERPLVNVCVYDAVFEETGDCCGRPLLHEGLPLWARVVPRRSGWSGALASPSLDASTRALAAEYWLHTALLEHASVASFARFTLELVRYGAPPDLLEDAQKAGLDEVAHARLCFALAERYAGAPIAPADMELGQLRLSASVAELAEDVVREGCVGETLAAIDAAARLKRATDPDVRRALQVIVEDESRHAALAWRTIAWLLTRDVDGSLRARLDAVFAACRPEPATTDEALPSAALQHGLLAARERQAVAVDAWARVIAPAWARHRDGTRAEA